MSIFTAYWQAFEVGEAAVAGAEVIKRDVAAELGSSCTNASATRCVGGECGLGDLADEQRRVGVSVAVGAAEIV